MLPPGYRVVSGPTGRQGIFAIDDDSNAGFTASDYTVQVLWATEGELPYGFGQRPPEEVLAEILAHYGHLEREDSSISGEAQGFTIRVRGLGIDNYLRQEQYVYPGTGQLIILSAYMNTREVPRQSQLDGFKVLADSLVLAN
jgi:hypothetical protein